MLCSWIYLLLLLLCDHFLCDESTLPARISIPSIFPPIVDSGIPETSNGAALITTLFAEVAGTQGLELQSAVTTESPIPFVTAQTTPLVTLNGEELPMKVVPPTEMEVKYHSYLTESPPTTQELTEHTTTFESIGSTASPDTTAQPAEFEDATTLATAVEELKSEISTDDPTPTPTFPSTVISSGFEVTSTSESFTDLTTTTTTSLLLTSENVILRTTETTVEKIRGVSDIVSFDTPSFAEMSSGVAIVSTEEVKVSVLTAVSHGTSPESAGTDLPKIDVVTDLPTVTEGEDVSAAEKSEGVSEIPSPTDTVIPEAEAGAADSPLSETTHSCSTTSAATAVELATIAQERAEVTLVPKLTPSSTGATVVWMDTTEMEMTTTEMETSLPPQITAVESQTVGSLASAEPDLITSLSSSGVMATRSSKAEITQTHAPNPAGQASAKSVVPVVTSQKPDETTVPSVETGTFFFSTVDSSLAAGKVTETSILTEQSSTPPFLEITTETDRSIEQDSLQSVLSVDLTTDEETQNSDSPIIKISTASTPMQSTVSSQIHESAESTSNEVVIITTLPPILVASSVQESATAKIGIEGMPLTEETLASLTTLMTNEESPKISTLELLSTPKVAQTDVLPSSEIESVNSTEATVGVPSRASSSIETIKMTESKADVGIDSSLPPKVDLTTTGILSEITAAAVPTGNEAGAGGTEISTEFSISTILGSIPHESTKESGKPPGIEITFSLSTSATTGEVRPPEETTPVTMAISETTSDMLKEDGIGYAKTEPPLIKGTLVVPEVVTTLSQLLIIEAETTTKVPETTEDTAEITSVVFKKDEVEDITTESAPPTFDTSTIPAVGTALPKLVITEAEMIAKTPATAAGTAENILTVLKDDKIEDTDTKAPPFIKDTSAVPAIWTSPLQPVVNEFEPTIKVPETTINISEFTSTDKSTIFTEAETTPKAPETPAPTVQANLQPVKDDSEGMTLATAISMGLILIFMLILLCILAVSLIAGWVHCRGRESRHPKVSLIRVERGLATEFADSWSKGRSAQAWMTTQSGGSLPPPQLAASSAQHQPLSASQSFKCSCKRKGLFGHSNRLCMIHGDPTVRHPSSPVRAVKIISLSDEDEADAVLLTQLGRRRASGASNTPNGEDGEGGSERDSIGKRRSEWLFIDEA